MPDEPLNSPVLMARFAVDNNEQEKGLGRALFRDALRRAIAVCECVSV